MNNKTTLEKHQFQPNIISKGQNLEQVTHNRVINIGGFDFMDVPTDNLENVIRRSEIPHVPQSAYSSPNQSQFQPNLYTHPVQSQPISSHYCTNILANERQPALNNAPQWMNSLAQFISRTAHIFSTQQQNQQAMNHFPQQQPAMTQPNAPTNYHLNGPHTHHHHHNPYDTYRQPPPIPNYTLSNDHQRIQALQLQSQFQQLQKQHELIRVQEQVILALKHREQSRVRQLLINNLMANGITTTNPNQSNNYQDENQKTRSSSSLSLPAIKQPRCARSEPVKNEKPQGQQIKNQLYPNQNSQDKNTQNKLLEASPSSCYQASRVPTSDDYQSKLLLEDVKENQRLKEQQFFDSVLSYHGKQLRVLIDQIPQDDRIVIKHKMKRETPFTKKRKLTTSRYRGVFQSGRHFRCLFKKNGIIKKNLGYYETEEGAARAYDQEDIRTHGIKANTNFAYSKGQIAKILKDDVRRIIKSPFRDEL